MNYGDLRRLVIKIRDKVLGLSLCRSVASRILSAVTPFYEGAIIGFGDWGLCG